MPTLYRIYCEHCDAVGGKDQPNFKGFAGAAITGGNSAGVVTQGWRRSVLKEDGEWAPIRHPIEDADMRLSGYTYWSASVSGRLIITHEMICLRCGILNETSKLEFISPVFCFVSLGLAIGCLFLPIGEWRFPILFVALYLSTLLPTHIIRILYWNRGKELRLKHCTGCGGRKFQSIESAIRKPAICPRCKQRTQKVEVAGRS